MKQKVYSFLDGLILTTVAAIIANVNEKTKKADIVDEAGTLLVQGAPFSETPKDGHWSEVTEYVPGPPEPDERDARIADLEARLAAAEASAAASGESTKAKPPAKG